MTALYSGMQQQKAYDTQADMENLQGQQAINDASVQMQQKAIQVQQAAGNQGEEYASSGVTLQGTPAEIMAQTRNLGQTELNQISRKGTLQAQMDQTKANADQAAGRAAILSAIGNQASQVAQFI